MMDKVCLRKLVHEGYLVFDETVCDTNCSAEELAMIVNSFSSLGYAIDREGLIKLSKLDSSSLTKFYNENYKLLSEISGAKFKHKVFYKNFPKLEDLSQIEYVVRAILHYLTSSFESDGFMNQDIEDFEREIVHNEKKKVLKLITKDEGKKLLIRHVEELFEANVSIPYIEEELIWIIMDNYPLELHVKEIPFKENIAHYFLFLFRGKKEKIAARANLIE